MEKSRKILLQERRQAVQRQQIQNGKETNDNEENVAPPPRKQEV